MKKIVLGKIGLERQYIAQPNTLQKINQTPIIPKGFSLQNLSHDSPLKNQALEIVGDAFCFGFEPICTALKVDRFKMEEYGEHILKSESNQSIVLVNDEDDSVASVLFLESLQYSEIMEFLKNPEEYCSLFGLHAFAENPSLSKLLRDVDIDYFEGLPTEIKKEDPYFLYIALGAMNLKYQELNGMLTLLKAAELIIQEENNPTKIFAMYGEVSNGFYLKIAKELGFYEDKCIDYDQWGSSKAFPFKGVSQTIKDNLNKVGKWKDEYEKENYFGKISFVFKQIE